MRYGTESRNALGSNLPTFLREKHPHAQAGQLSTQLILNIIRIQTHKLLTQEVSVSYSLVVMLFMQ